MPVWHRPASLTRSLPGRGSAGIGCVERGHGARRTVEYAGAPRLALPLPASVRPRFAAGQEMRAGPAVYETRAATSSAMASDDVSPGDSIPNRFTRPSMPWVSGPWTTKSGADSPGP